MQRKQQYHFIVTGISSEAYTPKIIFNCAKLHSLLNTYLDISDYGKSIQKLAFAFIVQDTHNYSHKERMDYDVKKKRLYGQFKLAPTFIDGLNEKQVLKVLAETYLLRLENFITLDIIDFNLVILKQDVAKVFEVAGLLSAKELEV